MLDDGALSIEALQHRIRELETENSRLLEKLHQVDDFLVTEWVYMGPDTDYKAALYQAVGMNVYMALDPAVSSYAEAAFDLGEDVRDILKIAKKIAKDDIDWLSPQHMAKLSGDLAQWDAERNHNQDVSNVINRNLRQGVVWDWMCNTFGVEQCHNIAQRGIRLQEEANEAGQAAGVTYEQAKRVVDYVYSRPVGNLAQEIGGVEVTMLGLASAAGINAERAAILEVKRVLSKPADHFRARNKEKNDADLKATGI